MYAGDIAAAVGLKNTTTGDTLCDEKHPIILESMEFPEPVIRVAIEPKTKAGQEKMGIALAKLAEEDPTFRTYTDEETGQTIIAGMGELHLEIIVDRLLREFKVEANVGSAPGCLQRDRCARAADVDMKYARQSGGKGQYGHVKIIRGAQRIRQGLRVHQQDRGRRDPQGIHRPQLTKVFRAPCRTACWQAIHVVDVKGHSVRWLLPRSGLFGNGL